MDRILREKRFISPDAYVSNGVDPLLSRKLTNSVRSISTSINIVRSSFAAVRKIVNDPILDLCSDPELLSEWDILEKDFIETLKASQKVALKGATMIEDFLSIIMPYLLGYRDIAEKRQELKEYRITLERGGEQASVFANDLHIISTRVQQFESKWVLHSGAARKELRAQIVKLEVDIFKLTLSIEDTKQEFSNLRNQCFGWFDAAIKPEEYKVTVKDLKRDLAEKDRQKRHTKEAYQRQEISEVHVSKYAERIHGETDDLLVVWRWIKDDIDVIASQLEKCGNTNSPETYRRGLDKLGAQYVRLMRSLRKYSSALSTLDSTPKTSILRRIFE